MTTETRRIYGWEIEGFGTWAETDAAAGQRLRLSYEALYEVNTDKVYALGLADLPQKIPTTARVMEGHTTQSTMQIMIGDIDRADATGIRYGRLAARFFWKARPVAVATLTVALSAAGTLASVALIAGETVPVAGDLIYIGREVMVVEGVSGSGGTRALTVLRGQLGTTAEAHELDDAEVFLENPVKKDRRVTLYEYDATADTETARWRGVVESVEISDETMIICVACRDLMSALSKRKVAESRWVRSVQVSRRDTAGVGLDVLQVFDVAGAGGGVVPWPTFYGDLPDGFLPGTERYSGLSVGVKGMAAEVDGECVVLRAESVTLPEPGFARLYRHGVIDGLSREVSGGRVEADPTPKAMTAREVLVMDADSPLCLFKDDGAGSSDHPAIIMLNVMTSTGGATWDNGGSHTAGTNGDYDWLPGHWGLGLPVSWIDTAAFIRLTREYPTSALRARAGYIGGGEAGAGLGALDLLGDLAQAMCCYLYVTPEAQISIRRLADPGAGNVDASLDADDIAWAANEGDGQGETAEQPVYAIDIHACAQGPKGKAARIITAGTIGQRFVTRYRSLARKDKIESTMIYGDPQTYEVTGRDIQLLAEVYRWRYAYCLDALPTYRLRLVQGAPLVAAGQWVTLSHPSFIDNADFGRGFSAHRCLILEHTWDVREGTQEISVVDISPVTGATTLISPAWRISSVSSDTEFVVDGAHYSDGDRLYLSAGRRLSLWTGDGQLRSTALRAWTLTVNVVTGAVEMEDVFEDGGGTVTPAVGNILRLATYDETDAEWQGRYTFLGDASMEVDGQPNVRWDI